MKKEHCRKSFIRTKKTLSIMLAVMLLVSVCAPSLWVNASDEALCEHAHSEECFAAPYGHICSEEEGCMPIYPVTAGEAEGEEVADTDAEPIGWVCGAATIAVCEHADCVFGEPCLAGGAPIDENEAIPDAEYVEDEEDAVPAEETEAIPGDGDEAAPGDGATMAMMSIAPMADYTIDLSAPVSDVGVKFASGTPDTLTFDINANGHDYTITQGVTATAVTINIIFETNVVPASVTLDGINMEGIIDLQGDADVNLLMHGLSFISGRIHVADDGADVATLTIDSATNPGGFTPGTEALTVTNTDDPNAAAIGGGDGESGGIITINGGYLYATGWNGAGNSYGAGIGGGRYGSGGVFTMNGGNVYSHGSYPESGLSAICYGAGIGGGGSDDTSAAGSGGIISINGGYVNAYSARSYASPGSSRADAYGAAIGGGGSYDGKGGDGGTITISGKPSNPATNVTTSPSTYNTFGAGIGGGGSYSNDAGSGGIITVKEGRVNLSITGGGPDQTYSSAGAGMGGGGSHDGDGGSGGEITIRDIHSHNTLEVQVYSLGKGAALGGGGSYDGNGGDGGKITVNDCVGRVYATSTTYNADLICGAGIGGGGSVSGTGGAGGDITIKEVTLVSALSRTAVASIGISKAAGIGGGAGSVNGAGASISIDYTANVKAVAGGGSGGLPAIHANGVNAGNAYYVNAILDSNNTGGVNILVFRDGDITTVLRRESAPTVFNVTQQCKAFAFTVPESDFAVGYDSSSQVNYNIYAYNAGTPRFLAQIARSDDQGAAICSISDLDEYNDHNTGNPNEGWLPVKFLPKFYLDVVYDENWPDGIPGDGHAPDGSSDRIYSDVITVEANPYGLAKDGYAFIGWYGFDVSPNYRSISEVSGNTVIGTKKTITLGDWYNWLNYSTGLNELRFFAAWFPVPDVLNFAKNTASPFYTEAGVVKDTVDYTISFQMPSTMTYGYMATSGYISTYDSIRIEDVFPSDNLTYQGFTLTTNPQGNYSYMKTPVSPAPTPTLTTGSPDSSVSFTIPKSSISDNLIVTLTLTFEVDDNVNSDIMNTANLFITPYNGTEPLTPNNTATATLTEERYYVTYDANWPGGVAGTGTAPVDNTVYTYGATAAASANTGSLAKDDYDFLGWAYSNTAAAPDFEVSGAAVTPPDFTIGAGDVTLYAVWQKQPDLYTINFDLQGGAGTVASWTGYIGETITLPAGITKTGFTPLGYDIDPSFATAAYTGNSIDFDAAAVDYIFTGNANADNNLLISTLYAIWGQNGADYTVTVVGSYAAAGSSGEGTYAAGADVTINAGTRTGYSFTGWTTTDGIAFGSASSATTTFVMPAKNVTVTAGWQDGGSPPPPPPPDDPDPIQVSLTATKVVVGDTLAAGQFEFELLSSGQQVATATNGADGNIVFQQTFTAAGTYVYTMKEIQKAASDGWVYDTSEQTVTVTVTLSNKVLTASVAGTPTFTNTFTPAGAGEFTLILKKELLDANGSTTGTGMQFPINIYTAEEYQKTDGQPVRQVTLSANGASVTVSGLTSGKLYVVWEPTVSGYYTEKYVIDGTETANGAAVALDIAELSWNKPVSVTLTNRQGSDPGGGGTYTPGGSLPSVVTIVDTEPPLNPFISEHIAYIVGYAEGDVRPQRNITRAEVTTVFFRLLTDDLRSANWTRSNTFPDVKNGDWFNNSISVMSNMGIVKGYEDGTFGPNAAITRAELATIAARFARQMYVQQTGARDFSDIAGHWAQEDIRYAAAIGWVNGYPDGTFMPNQPITRAEFMTLVNRMLERVPETTADLISDGMVTWADNADPNAWYYLAVQEATNSHIPEFKTGSLVPGLQFEYERWSEMIENRDWAQLESVWSNMNAG